MCPPGSASSTCSCYSVTRSTTTVTTDAITVTLWANSTRLPLRPTNRTLVGGDASAFGNGRSTTPGGSYSGQSSTAAPFLNTTVGSLAPAQGPVVYVVNSTTTLVTITTSRQGSSSGTHTPRNNTTDGRSLRSVATNTNQFPLTRTLSWTNSTSIRPFNATASRLFNHSIAATAASTPANMTHPIWLNASATLPRITNRPWLNLSTLPPLGPTNTGPRWLNTSLPRSNATTTTARWQNTTTTSATPTATPSPDQGCDENTVPFRLRVSEPDGKFNSWFLRVSGLGLLFTSQEEQASRFGVGPSGALCAMGRLDSRGMPYVAVVEKDESGANGTGGSVWLMATGMLKVRGEEYSLLSCERADGGLVCRGGEGEGQPRRWLGCGMQLDLATDDGGIWPGRGLNCTAVDIGVVEG